MNAIALPSIVNAKLPKVYEDACDALAQCSRIDECADWANKAEAMASYARQSQDDSLRKTADRIQARAIRRCGELFKEIESAQGKRTDLEPKGGASPKLQAAHAAGLSVDQMKTAVRVANVPEPEFEDAVESDDPPTVTALAERGTTKRPIVLADLKGRDPRDFVLCTHAIGWVRDLHAFALKSDPVAVIRGASDKERQRFAEQVPVLLGWLNDLLAAAESESR